MSDTTDRAVFSRRIVLFSSILVAIVLVGVAMFFLYWGRVDPLVQSVLPITTLTTI
jgi:uncharacterized membrane protein YhhN